MCGMCTRLTNISNFKCVRSDTSFVPLYCSQYSSLLYSIVSTLTKMRDNHAGCVIVGRSGVRVCEGVGSCHKNWVLQKKAFIPKNLYQKNSG